MKQNPPTPKAKYKDGRKTTSLVVDEALMAIAKAHFPKTRYGSTSKFVDAKLREMIRKDADKIRAAGHRIPESVFSK